MVMRPEPFVHSVNELKKSSKLNPYILMTSPKGNKLSEKKVLELINKESIYILCGRYEGVDERVTELIVDEEISIGDYIVSGGELPAMIISDTLIRKLPSVLGSSESVIDETFSIKNKLKNKFPVYTRPEEFMGINVPKILLSGDHSKIKEWKKNNRF